MKKIIALTISFTMLFTTVVHGLTDDRILTDPVQNTYFGRTEAASMIKNLNFTDVPAGHWAKESIARAGALDLVKGDNLRYNPSGFVTNEEALAFIERVLGQELAAQQAAVAAQNALVNPAGLQTLWSIGYLNLARQNGLITRAQYNDALADQSLLDPQTNFIRGGTATREQVAQWLYQGLQIINPAVFALDLMSSRQKIYTFTDYTDVAVDKVTAVDVITSNNIMRGSEGRFRPKDGITRAEMAQLLVNMDTIYLSLVGIEKKTGTVGAVEDYQYTATGASSLGRQFYVRAQDGSVDNLVYVASVSSSPQSGDADAVVYKNGNIGGLLSLAENDQIEYLVSPVIGVYYVQVVNSAVSVKNVQGLLNAVDLVGRSITISDSTGKTFSYPLVEGVAGNDGAMDYVYISDKRRDITQLPIGSRVDLRLKNNIVDVITYVGEPTVFLEARGIVLENNPEFGYISYLNNSGAEVTKYYTENDIKVEKQPYYTQEDNIGYLDDMFPNFKYNPRDAIISEVEPGDIVFMRFDANEPNNIVRISASPNYIMKYGKIKTFATDGNISNMLIEYENKQTAWFDVADGIYISKDGRPVSAGTVRAGDWAKILVNQALVGPGQIIESVKEIALEGDEHFITNIVKGQVASINTVQNQMVIQNAQKLGKTGWEDYQNLSSFSLAGKDIEFYNNDSRVTLDYIEKYLKRTNGEVYVALENNFTGEKVKKVTFRGGRDELLAPDTVVAANGNGGFSVMSNNGTINTDSGTIVRRYGRLVDGSNIMAPDYAVVALNGANHAAVVDISDAPDISAITIIRGRIMSIDSGKSFKVQSMAILTGNSWSYTPVQREFAIDYNTLSLDDTGVKSINDFVEYGNDSSYDSVFTIVAEGSRAARVITALYPTVSVRGVIYDNTAGTLSLRGVEYLDNATGKWQTISHVNPVITITTAQNTLIAKENKLVQPGNLVNGDQVSVMIDPNVKLPITPNSSIAGIIIRVTK